MYKFTVCEERDGDLLSAMVSIIALEAVYLWRFRTEDSQSHSLSTQVRRMLFTSEIF